MSFNFAEEYGRQAKRKGQKLNVKNGSKDPFGNIFRNITNSVRNVTRDPFNKEGRGQPQTDGQLFKRTAGLMAPLARPQNMVERDPFRSRGKSNVSRPLTMFGNEPGSGSNAKGWDGGMTMWDGGGGGGAVGGEGGGFGFDEGLIKSLLENEYLKPRTAEDITAFSRKGADEELSKVLGMLDQILGTAQSNYNKSDANLEAMYRAHQNDVRKNSTARQRDITADSLGAIRDTSANSIDALTQASSDKNRQTSNLLANLGIGAAAAQPDDYDPLAEGQAEIAQNSARSQDRINEIGAANLASTQRMADSVGLEGKGQRSNLMQMLASFQNDIGMQKADYQNDYAQAMRNLLMQGESLANQERNNYAQFQFGLGQSMLDGEMQTQLQEQAARAKAQQDAQEYERELALLDREQDWRYRNTALESETALKKALMNQRPNQVYDPRQKALEAMLKNADNPQSVQEALAWFANQMR